MKFYENQYYHLYNRTNNNELLFKNRDNYIYFLKKYRLHFDEIFDTKSYCLMPTHFHFLIKVKSIDYSPILLNFTKERIFQSGIQILSKDPELLIINQKINVWLRSYTQAFNKMHLRHGSLFQKHTKSKIVEDENYFITLATYIHQNPVRNKLVNKSEDWEFSSYQDYINLRNGKLPKTEYLLNRYSIEDLRIFTNKEITKIQEKYWI